MSYLKEKWKILQYNPGVNNWSGIWNAYHRIGSSEDHVWSEEVTVTWEVIEKMLAQGSVVSACCGTETPRLGEWGHPLLVHKVYRIWKLGTSPRSKHSFTKWLLRDAKVCLWEKDATISDTDATGEWDNPAISSALYRPSFQQVHMTWY